jgi:hypothetical protein
VGRCVSEIKKKRRRRGTQAAAGGRTMGRWAGWAEKEGEVSFPFSFKTLFKFKPFSTQNLSKLFKLFHKIL